MDITIPETYKDGTPVMEGDIVAEGHVNDIIWDGKAIITRRPLGVVVVTPRKKLTLANTILDKTEFYNVQQIRVGKAEFTDECEEWFGEMIKDIPEEQRYQDLHLSTWDGGFYAWDNIEKVGSIYDFND